MRLIDVTLAFPFLPLVLVLPASLALTVVVLGFAFIGYACASVPCAISAGACTWCC